MMPTLTPEQEADAKVRVEEFKKDYSSLVEKHQVDFYAYPNLVPNRNGTFEVGATMTIFDKKYMPVPSPLQAES